MTQTDLLVKELIDLFAAYGLSVPEDLIQELRETHKAVRPDNWPPVEYDDYLATLFVVKIPSEGG